MMTLHDLLKARFKMAREDLEQVLRQLTDADLPWAPADGMRTVGGQLIEIATKEIEVIGWIRGGSYDEVDTDSFGERAKSIEGMRAVLADIRADTLAYLDSLSETDLQESVSCPEEWWEALRLTACPKSEILRNIAAHEWYHTGQLVSYLWMRGNHPYSW